MMLIFAHNMTCDIYHSVLCPALKLSQVPWVNCIGYMCRLYCGKVARMTVSARDNVVDF